jgi:hypothetical protein
VLIFVEGSYRDVAIASGMLEQRIDKGLDLIPVGLESPVAFRASLLLFSPFVIFSGPAVTGFP